MAVARLATADADGRPHLVPICFVLIDDSVYSVVDRKPKSRPLELKRLRNIRENAEVAVLVDRYDEDWQRLAWVMLRGRASVVEDTGEYTRALAALREKYPQYRDMRLLPEENPMVRLDVASVRYWTAA